MIWLMLLTGQHRVLSMMPRHLFFKGEASTAKRLRDLCCMLQYSFLHTDVLV